MNIWLVKPAGLYDTYEPADYTDEWFEDEEEPWEWKLKGSYRGWSVRPVRY